MTQDSKYSNLVLSFKDDEEYQQFKDSIKTKTTWELATFTQFENARSFAIEHGWRATPQKVQIRVQKTGWDFSPEYVIEPYEGECTCPNIIRPF